MTLVDAETSRKIHASLSETRAVSGGSAANTAAIAAMLGARVAYAGKTSGDALGQSFAADMDALGVASVIAPETSGPDTGSCLSLITPDAQRTMCTHLGAATTLQAADISQAALTDADIVFLEGYLLDAPGGYEIFRHVIAARPQTLALTLSDAGCVDRHAAFLDAILGSIDLLFGNEEEMGALFPETTGPAQATLAAARHVAGVICTDGPNGVHIGEHGLHAQLPAVKAEVRDTTGAGDSLAGTVLWGLAAGHSLIDSARMATHVAAEVISGVGARPARDLRDILAQAGYLGTPAEA